MRSRVIQQEGERQVDERPSRTGTDGLATSIPGTVLVPAHSPVPASRARTGRLTPLKPGALWRFPGASSVVSTELWVGVHLCESTSAGDELERLAVRAQRFTPRISLVPPDGLVLEVKGSLHLFKGVEGLSRALANECVSMGLKPQLALAPTPLAALVAARVRPFVVMDMARLVGQLTPLPLMALRWPQETLERLALMGVRTIGQALRLPRAGFARRFGTEQLAILDRLTGRNPDLRARFHERERFRRRRELTYELENHDAILAALAPLLADLGKFLEARQCGVMELECLLRHRHAPPTSCVLRLATPLADVRRLTELLGERLNVLALPEPVRTCELRSSSLVSRVLSSNHIWQPGEHGGGAGAEAPELIERLRARLGPEAVYGLRVLPGHRPENAWGATEPVEVRRQRGASGQKRAAHEVAVHVPWPAFRRPTWLLPAPKLLSVRDGLPRRRGPLRLLGEPERIETGWWDGGDIARDYYTAVDIHGVRLWIFRERNPPHRWFLHGVFG
jgi:protein ImuB